MPPRSSAPQASGAVHTPGAIRFGHALGLSDTVLFSPSIGFIASRLEKLGVDIRSFRSPLHQAVVEVMIPSIRANFEAESARSGSIGVPWEPLSDFSLKMRDMGKVRFDKGGASGDRILDATGALKRKATQVNLWNIDREKAEIQDLPQSVWYGKVHQAGYPPGVAIAIRRGATAKEAGALIKKHNVTGLHEIGGSRGRTAPDVPARPFLVVQPEDEQAVKDVFTVWLTERVDASFKW